MEESSFDWLNYYKELQNKFQLFRKNLSSVINGSLPLFTELYSSLFAKDFFEDRISESYINFLNIYRKDIDFIINSIQENISKDCLKKPLVGEWIKSEDLLKVYLKCQEQYYNLCSICKNVYDSFNPLKNYLTGNHTGELPILFKDFLDANSDNLKLTYLNPGYKLGVENIFCKSLSEPMPTDDESKFGVVIRTDRVGFKLLGDLIDEVPVLIVHYSFKNTSNSSELDSSGSVSSSKFRLKFFGNGGKGNVESMQSPGSISLPSPQDLGIVPPKFKIFEGWSFERNGEIFAAGSKIEIQSDTKLYANWIVESHYLTINCKFNNDFIPGESVKILLKAGEKYLLKKEIPGYHQITPYKELIMESADLCETILYCKDPRQELALNDGKKYCKIAELSSSIKLIQDKSKSCGDYLRPDHFELMAYNRVFARGSFDNAFLCKFHIDEVNNSFSFKCEFLSEEFPSLDQWKIIKGDEIRGSKFWLKIESFVRGDEYTLKNLKLKLIQLDAHHIIIEALFEKIKTIYTVTWKYRSFDSVNYIELGHQCVEYKQHVSFEPINIQTPYPYTVRGIKWDPDYSCPITSDLTVKGKIE